jgi:hypothetical protein
VGDVILSENNPTEAADHPCRIAEVLPKNVVPCVVFVGEKFPLDFFCPLSFFPDCFFGHGIGVLEPRMRFPLGR